MNNEKNCRKKNIRELFKEVENGNSKKFKNLNSNKRSKTKMEICEL